MAFACIPVHLREGKLPIKTHCNLVINGRLEPSRAFRGDGSGFTSDTRSLHVPQLTENLKKTTENTACSFVWPCSSTTPGSAKMELNQMRNLFFFFAAKTESDTDVEGGYTKSAKRGWNRECIMVHSMSSTWVELGFTDISGGLWSCLTGLIRSAMQRAVRLCFSKGWFYFNFSASPPRHDLFPPKCANPIEVNRRSCFMLQCLIWSDSAL